MKPLHILAAIWLLATPLLAYEGTTTFDSILVAHAAPSICPVVTANFDSYIPDANYAACCNQWYGSYTLTTGLGPGSKPMYACCQSGYTCTPPVSLMKDWTVDTNGDLQTFDLPNPPTPTPAAEATSRPVVTTAGPSTGTFSNPGASPIATSSGVVVYIWNNNENSNQNDVNIGSGGTSLSSGAIAGITVACTIVSAIAAVLGVWYAREQNRIRKAKAAARTPSSDPSAPPKDLATDPSAAWQQRPTEMAGHYPH